MQCSLRSQCLRVGGLLAVLLEGCAGARASRTAPMVTRPRFVAVTLHDAVIAPTKRDGTSWDWTASDVNGHAIEQTTNAIAAALAMTNAQAAFVQVAAIMAGPLTRGLAKPDVFGWVDLSCGDDCPGRPFERAFLRSQEDTFTPLFVSMPVWRRVPLGTRTRLTVRLFDEDVVEDDPIGDVVLTADDLARALADGGNTALRVSNQGAGQVLFVGVSVVAE